MTPLETIRDRIRLATLAAKRDEAPELVAVSKTQPLSAILSLYREGQRTFGENYVQELLEKKKELDAQNIQDIDFHFIGHLQTNKVKQVLPCVSTIHSVDSLKLYLEISKRAAILEKMISVYFQVNIDEEESKNGILPNDTAELAKAIQSEPSPWVRRLGLMAIPNPDLDPRLSFQKVQKLSSEYQSVLGPGLSIGMTKDFELAIAYGSNSIRIGTALFGPRV